VHTRNILEIVFARIFLVPYPLREVNRQTLLVLSGLMKYELSIPFPCPFFVPQMQLIWCLRGLRGPHSSERRSPDTTAR
jgi:hypothetical protein